MKPTKERGKEGEREEGKEGALETERQINAMHLCCSDATRDSEHLLCITQSVSMLYPVLPTIQQFMSTAFMGQKLTDPFRHST